MLSVKPHIFQLSHIIASHVTFNSIHLIHMFPQTSYMSTWGIFIDYKIPTLHCVCHRKVLRISYDFMYLWSLQWRHNELDSVSNHQPHECLFKLLFRRRSKKTSKSASLAFVRGSHRRPVNSPHKGPVTRKMFPFDDVIMWYMGMFHDPQYSRMRRWYRPKSTIHNDEKCDRWDASYLKTFCILVFNSTLTEFWYSMWINLCV